MKKSYFILVIVFSLLVSCGLSKKEKIEIYQKVFEIEKNNGSAAALKYLDENIPSLSQDYMYYSVYGRILRDTDPNLMSGFAAEYLLHSYKKNKKVFMTNYLLGQTFAILEKYDDAYFYFKNAEMLAKQKRNKERNLTEPYFELANVCIHLGKFQEALEYNEKIPQQETNENECKRILQREIILSELEDKSKLDEYYTLATEQYQNSSVVDTDIVRLYAKQKTALGEYDQAILIYENLINKDGLQNNSFLYSDLAADYLFKKDFDNVEIALKKAYELNNNNKTCLKIYALFYYFVKEDFETAASYAVKSINVNFYSPDYMAIETEKDLLSYFNTDAFVDYKKFITELSR